MAGYEPVSPRHAAILKSWRDHSDKGEQVQLWRSLERAAKKYAEKYAEEHPEEHGLPVPQPAGFIGDVLGCAMPASRLNEHTKHVLKLFEKLKREIIEVVKDADHPLDLWRDLQRFEEPLWYLEKSYYPTDQPAGGRKDVNDSRDRKLFAQHMLRYLKASCGKPLAKEVTVMINIIFPDVVTEPRLVREWLSEISPKKSMSRIVRTHI